MTKYDTTLVHDLLDYKEEFDFDSCPSIKDCAKRMAESDLATGNGSQTGTEFYTEVGDIKYYFNTPSTDPRVRSDSFRDAILSAYIPPEINNLVIDTATDVHLEASNNDYYTLVPTSMGEFLFYEMENLERLHIKSFSNYIITNNMFYTNTKLKFLRIGGYYQPLGTTNWDPEGKSASELEAHYRLISTSRPTAVKGLGEYFLQNFGPCKIFLYKVISATS